MLEIKNSDVFTTKNSLVLKNILNETYFALDCDTGSQYDLTEMEYEILSKISKKYTFESILSFIVSNYSVSAEQAKSDLVEYFSILYEASVIEKNI